MEINKKLSKYPLNDLDTIKTHIDESDLFNFSFNYTLPNYNKNLQNFSKKLQGNNNNLQSNNTSTHYSEKKELKKCQKQQCNKYVLQQEKLIHTQLQQMYIEFFKKQEKVQEDENIYVGKFIEY